MSPVYWVGSPKYTAGHPAPLIALVHHRMVGTLRSTDAAFTRSDGREASTTFGVGYGCGRAGHPTSAHVHQYVRLGDQAFRQRQLGSLGRLGRPLSHDPRQRPHDQHRAPRQRPMNGLELVLAFLAGVVMGGALDGWLPQMIVNRGGSSSRTDHCSATVPAVSRRPD